jgi:DNA-binding NarL/FixJ family response regulator
LIHIRLRVRSPALRAGLSSLIADDPDFEVVEGGPAATSGEATVLIVASASEDLDAIWESSSPPDWAILLLRDEPVDLAHLRMTPRAWGVLPLDASAEELRVAIRALAVGLVVGAGSLLGAGLANPPASGPLTEREVQVLGLLATGLANKQIALELGISEHTVKFHVSAIYGKLNASNRTQAVREGLRHGWITL